jgi:hypothetical protein
VEILNTSEARFFERRRLSKIVAVNQGVPNRGGVLMDLSLGGAAIVYPEDLEADDQPLKVGEVLAVDLGGSTPIPSRLVRVFDGGFAIKFDFSLDVPGQARAYT